MKRLFTLLLISLLFTIYSKAQLNEGGKPSGFNHNLTMNDIPVVKMPDVDVIQLLAEDEINNQFKDTPWRFG